MDSSDSEDDCYGNIAQKLQSMKNTYKEDKIETTNLLNVSAEAVVAEIVKKTIDVSKVNKEPPSESQQSGDSTKSCNNDDALIDTLVASSSIRLTRSAAKRGSIDDSIETAPPKKSTRKKNKAASKETSADKSTRGVENSNTSLNNSSNRGRGRGRGRAKRNRNPRMCLPMDPFQRALILSMQPDNNIPTYSVGNTAEYPDQSDNQALFSTNSKHDDVVIVEDNDLEENEELSVKVYWQSSEFFKFTVRRYQKLTQIFDYFAKKEGVSNDKLLFTFNEKILKPDDTPDSIDYTIVKFIDGGIVSQSVSKLVTDKKSTDRKDGIKLKFQCQNVKKPFEIIVGLDEKMSIAMMKYAEHLEMTVDKLKFQFDGDLISGKDTARALELEGGECIDVKITS